MLNLWTSKDKVPSSLQLIEGVGSYFSYSTSIFSYDDDLSREMMLYIDGVSFKKGNYVETKFGSTDIKNLSSGCKTGLLALNYKDKACVSLMSAGENVFKKLYELARDKDLELNLLLPRVYGISLFKESTFKVNGVLYKDEFIADVLEDLEEWY